MFSHKRNDFGPGFTFGAATAAYQIEGGQTDGRGPSIWDSFSNTAGNVKNQDTGLIACDHYNRWPEDLDLLKHAGFDAYRFSFSWPRMFPEGRGRPNHKGLAFYDRLVDGMLERNLAPHATLFHWDLPSALQDQGGWMNRDIANWFTDYALFINEHFGDRLTSIATINEPWCVAFLSHYYGIHAPGYRDLRAAARASHHVLLAHGTAINALRSDGAKNLGIVLNFEHAMPATNAPEDQSAATLYDGLYNRWYLDGIFKAQYPADIVHEFGPHMPKDYEADMEIISTPLDWLGINYYTRALIKHVPNQKHFAVEKAEGPLEKTDLNWEIYPQGLEAILTRISTHYTKIPLYVTENGMAEFTPHDDHRRIAYFEKHLQSVLNAKQKGVDIRGYFAWSLLDNYEWSEGYGQRFGLVHVDYTTQQRTPKLSYKSFAEMLL